MKYQLWLLFYRNSQTTLVSDLFLAREAFKMRRTHINCRRTASGRYCLPMAPDMKGRNQSYGMVS